jgi:hypothetical protein
VCTIPKAVRGNITFDIVLNNRYHFDTVYKRRDGQELRGQVKTKFFKDLGLREDPPTIAAIALTLDLILSRGYDVPYSKWRGIGRVLLSILFNNIFTKRGRDSFIKRFQDYPFLIGWLRIQSLLHLFSWSLLETGRVMIIIPLLLCSYVKTLWFRMPYM